jgi:tetratricopeptide (TPR) repeat protein
LCANYTMLIRFMRLIKLIFFINFINSINIINYSKISFVYPKLKISLHWETTMSSFKLIFKGRLEFGNPRSFELMSKHFLTRTETIYRSDVVLKPEQVLDAENHTLFIPDNNYVVVGTEKAWRTTAIMMKELAQYAVAGNVKAWCLNEGNLVGHFVFEPSSDKAVVKDFMVGRDLVDQKGREIEARDVLSRAIERYQNHALAYERRGYVNYRLKNYKDALYDFSKSVDINPHQAEAFFGRGKVKMIKQDWQGALEDFEMAMKKSIALQPFFWQARRAKGEVLMHLKRFAEANEEFGKYLDRKFKTDDSNYDWRRKVTFLYGKSHLDAGNTAESIAFFTKSLDILEGKEFTPDSTVYFTRGMAQKQLGKREGFKKDIQEAARQGHAEAVKMLAEM